MKQLLVINGHPDPRPARFCAALCDAYERGAAESGWHTRRLEVGSMPLSMLACGDGAALGEAAASLAWAARLVIVFPLWFGRPPELLSKLFERLAHPETRSAHLVITMDMPAFALRSELRHSDAVLSLPGITAVDPVLIGCVARISPEQRRHWLDIMRRHGGVRRSPLPDIVHWF